MKRPLSGAIVLGLVALIGSACNGNRRAEVPLGFHALKVNGREILVEIANTPGRRETGLMYRDGLATDRGMVFAFPNSEERSFYMKNCRFPIDIAFLDAKGVIVTIHTMTVESDAQVYNHKRYPSGQPVPYALEMTGGWYAANGVKVGDKVENLPRQPLQ